MDTQTPMNNENVLIHGYHADKLGIEAGLYPLREAVTLLEGLTVWGARCDCYNGHNSNSGRCNVRDITIPALQYFRDEMRVVCPSCKTE